MAITDAISEIQTQIAALTGIRKAPTEPPDQINVFPTAICYPLSGTWTHDTPESKRALHNIAIDIHAARRDMARDFSKAVAYVDTVPNALMVALRDGTFTNIQAFGQITYEFASFEYGGIATIGFRFIITNVKMRSTLT